MKKIIFFLLITSSIFAQNNVASTKKHEVEWLTIQEAFTRTQKEPRKTIVDVYTAWCGWCKVMDKQTYTNPEVIDYLNKNFYCIHFNAERTDEKLVHHESLRMEIERSLRTLTERQKDVVCYFFGIGVDHPLSLEDIGERYSLTRERVRQIKDKAITKLRNASRSKLLRSYLGT